MILASMVFISLLVLTVTYFSLLYVLFCIVKEEKNMKRGSNYERIV